MWQTLIDSMQPHTLKCIHQTIRTEYLERLADLVETEDDTALQNLSIMQRAQSDLASTYHDLMGEPING